jgi:hypothetical protein
MRATRTFVVIAACLAIFVIAVALWFAGGAPRSTAESVRTEPPARVAVERERTTGAVPHVERDAKAAPHARTSDRPGRAAMRRDIVRALERRGIDPSATVDAPTRAADDEPAGGAPAGALEDRIGGRDALLGRLNADFMPLADECMQQARERVPEMRGLVAIDVKLLAERDVGAIVEQAGPASINEIADPELLECLEQTLYSMTLPGDAVDGLEGVMISLRADET